MDPEYETSGERDERDLTEEWLENYKNSYFVWNQQQFDAIDQRLQIICLAYLNHRTCSTIMIAQLMKQVSRWVK